MNEQIKLIKEDINFIEKYYGTYNFNGLINDMLLHLKAVENQIAAYKDKEDRLREYIKSNWVIDEPIKFKNDIFQILNEGDKE